MSIVGKIDARELNRQLTMTVVETPTATPTTLTVWAKVVAYLDLPYWTSNSVGFVIRVPENLLTDYWRGWYITYGGLNYNIYQFQIVDDVSAGKFVFIEGRSSSFTSSEPTIGDYGTYASDAAAASAGLAVGDPYWAAAGHDRAAIGTLTKRIE